MTTDYEYLTAVREFLLTCPFPAPVSLNYTLLSTAGIDYGEIKDCQNSDETGSGTAITMTGDQIINRRRSVTGNETHTKRTNFAVVFWRDTQENEFRNNIANFLNRFINWVNEENAKRRTKAANPALPHFSMTEKETISADGGIRTAILADGRSEYQIQVHCDYQITY